MLSSSLPHAHKLAHTSSARGQAILFFSIISLVRLRAPNRSHALCISTDTRARTEVQRVQNSAPRQRSVSARMMSAALVPPLVLCELAVESAAVSGARSRLSAPLHNSSVRVVQRASGRLHNSHAVLLKGAQRAPCSAFRNTREMAAFTNRGAGPRLLAGFGTAAAIGHGEGRHPHGVLQ